MPKHEISAGLPAHRVVNTDLSVIVNSDGQRLGELLISKGSLDWRPARHQYSVKISWENFARLMERWHDGDLR